MRSEEDRQTPTSSSPAVPFVDLSTQWLQIEEGTLRDLRRLMATSDFCLGSFVERFEREIAEYLGAHHAIGVNSGTSALHLALLVAGVGPGDKVLLPSLTFIATAWAPLYLGATPVLCDVEPGSGTIDVADARRRLDGSVKAIIPVHLYGQPADMTAVAAFAAEYGLIVVEDAAQAIGATSGGRRVGTIGRLGCFSFYPSKNLGAAGEAGLVVTDDPNLSARLRALRNHAQSERYLHAELGFNYRMEGFQALILAQKLPLLDRWNDERRALARRYAAGLAGLPLNLPEIVHQDHVFHLYVVRSRERDRLRAYLRERNVATGLHYPVPLHRQPCLEHLGGIDPEGFPVTERYAGECLSLPFFVGMTEEQVDRVCLSIHDFFAGR